MVARPLQRRSRFLVATPLRDAGTKVGLDLGEALRAAGEEVAYFDYDRRPFPLALYPKPLRTAGYLQRSRDAINRALLTQARKLRPDYLLVVKGVQLEPETIRAISALGTTTVGYWIDDPLDHARSMVNAPAYDIYLTNCSATVARYRAAGLQRVHHLPSAVNTRLFAPLNCPQPWPASFLGTHSAYREKILQGFEPEGLQVFGPGWRKNGHLPRARCHDAAFGEQTNRVFNRSRLNLNIHNWFGQGAAMNLRLYEVPAAGGFLLTDWVEEIDRYFEQDKHVVCWRSLDELNDKARFYLAHDAARRRIARAGHEHVLNNHSYASRVRELLALIRS